MVAVDSPRKEDRCDRCLDYGVTESFKGPRQGTEVRSSNKNGTEEVITIMTLDLQDE